MFAFLWSGKAVSDHYHLANWELLSLPIKFGGWNIKVKQVFWFNWALTLNNCWRGIFGVNLWSVVLRAKYIKTDLHSWLRNPSSNPRTASFFWKGFMKLFPWISAFLPWHVGDGTEVIVGLDPILGIESQCQLSVELRNFFMNRGLFSLSHFKRRNGLLSDSAYWSSAADLGLSGQLAREWDGYLHLLNEAGIRLTCDKDVLAW